MLLDVYHRIKQTWLHLHDTRCDTYPSTDTSKDLGVQDLQSAVRLVFPEELANHAVAEGDRAVEKFRSAS